MDPGGQPPLRSVLPHTERFRPSEGQRMARVFTVFNHGTAFHRDAGGEEVVTLLHDAAEGSEARLIQAAGTQANPSGFRLVTASPSYLICEGPGSAEVSA